MKPCHRDHPASAPKRVASRVGLSRPFRRVALDPVRFLVRIGACGLLALMVTGSSAAAPPYPADRTGGPVVELPPFVVTTDAMNAHPWRYASGPGCEILARCSDWVARDFFRRYETLLELFRTVLPDRFQQITDTPDTIVLVDQRQVPGLGRDILARFDADAGGAPGQGAARSAATGRVRFLPNMALYDVDRFAVLALVDEGEFRADTLTFHLDRVKLRLERRAPPLPAWFIDGFLTLYNDLWFRDESVEVVPLTWIDETATTALRNDPDYPRTFLPLSDLFENGRPAATPENVRILQLWRSEAALFIRWALDGKGTARRTAFWKLVDRASLGPVTEPVVRDCLGLNYADLRDRLSDYLPVAVRTAFRLRPDTPVPRHAPRLRDATPAEIARMEGDCERLEVDYVRSRRPRYVPPYLNQARRTLWDAYRQGIRDPQMLAVLGLLECDAGRDGEAQPFLSQAANAQVRRPRIYLELARIIWTESLRHLQGPGNRPDPEQTKEVLACLAAAHALQPPLAATYTLTADVWARSAAVLDARQFALLDEGLRLFPREPDLVYDAAVLRAQHGFVPEAIALTERGLALTAGRDWEFKFRRLRAALPGVPEKDVNAATDPLRTSPAAATGRSRNR